MSNLSLLNFSTKGTEDIYPLLFRCFSWRPISALPSFLDRDFQTEQPRFSRSYRLCSNCHSPIWIALLIVELRSFFLQLKIIFSSSSVLFCAFSLFLPDVFLSLLSRRNSEQSERSAKQSTLPSTWQRR